MSKIDDLPPTQPARSFVRRRWLMLGMLVVLHGVLLLGADSAIGRSLLIVHFGLFLLWQPFVRSGPALPSRHVVLFLLLLAAFISLGRWALIMWIILLAGIVGGRVFFNASRVLRLFYLVALADLIAMLLLVAVPAVIPSALLLGDEVIRGAHYLLPLLLGFMLVLLPLQTEQKHEPSAEVIDLLYSLFVVLLLAVLVFASIAIMLLRSVAYVEALFDTLLAIPFMLMLLALAWSPRAGFSGLGAVLSRYLLAEGLPFDRLLKDFTELSRQIDTPEAFVEGACLESLNYLPWINGGRWRIGDDVHVLTGDFGRLDGVESRYVQGEFQLSLYSHSALPPTLAWHSKLLTQLLAEFALTKMQAMKLRQMSYLQAIHETGARLTHDVKNLLQSLNTLVAASERAEATQSADFQALLRRQLPTITQRLQQTVNKLQKPASDTGQFMVGAQWWDHLSRRYDTAGLEMHAEESALAALVPLSLFDSAAENFLQNAFDKQALQPLLKIVVRFATISGQPVLEVRDDGVAVAASLARHLGHGLVPSENGLGIGLYQVARQAESMNYQIALLSNREGDVRISLQPVTV